MIGGFSSLLIPFLISTFGVHGFLDLESAGSLPRGICSGFLMRQLFLCGARTSRMCGLLLQALLAVVAVGNCAGLML